MDLLVFNLLVAWLVQEASLLIPKTCLHVPRENNVPFFPYFFLYQFDNDNSFV